MHFSAIVLHRIEPTRRDRNRAQHCGSNADTLPPRFLVLTFPGTIQIGNDHMATMRAMQVKSPGGDFELVHREIPEPKRDEVLIKVQACGVCHGEAVIKWGHFPGLTYPRIPGHEVIGTIDKVGPGIHDWKPGARVGVGWHGGHCFKCPACRRGDFWSCENSLITGITVDGGYAGT